MWDATRWSISPKSGRRTDPSATCPTSPGASIRVSSTTFPSRPSPPPPPGRVCAGGAGRGGVVGTLAGTVLHARERQGKSGNPYAFVAFSDPTGQFEAVVFSEVLAASRPLLEPGTAVLLEVEAEADGESVKVRVQRLLSLDRAAEARHAGMKIYVEDIRALAPLAEQVGSGGGQGQFRLVLRLDDREVEFVLPQGIDATPKQRSALKLVQGVAAISALEGP